MLSSVWSAVTRRCRRSRFRSCFARSSCPSVRARRKRPPMGAAIPLLMKTPRSCHLSLPPKEPPGPTLVRVPCDDLREYRRDPACSQSPEVGILRLDLGRTRLLGSRARPGGRRAAAAPVSAGRRGGARSCAVGPGSAGGTGGDADSIGGGASGRRRPRSRRSSRRRRSCRAAGAGAGAGAVGWARRGCARAALEWAARAPVSSGVRAPPGRRSARARAARRRRRARARRRCDRRRRALPAAAARRVVVVPVATRRAPQTRRSSDGRRRARHRGPRRGRRALKRPRGGARPFRSRRRPCWSILAPWRGRSGVRRSRSHPAVRARARGRGRPCGRRPPRAVCSRRGGLRAAGGRRR